MRAWMQVEEIKIVKFGLPNVPNFTCKCSIFASHGCRVLDTPVNMLVPNWAQWNKVTLIKTKLRSLLHLLHLFQMLGIFQTWRDLFYVGQKDNENIWKRWFKNSKSILKLLKPVSKLCTWQHHAGGVKALSKALLRCGPTQMLRYL